MNNLKLQLLEIYKNSNTSTQKLSFAIVLYEEIEKLLANLEEGEYSPSTYSCFVVKDPKIREIFAPVFRDRLIHHILVDSIDKFIDKRFIFDSYANRKDKGVHKAITRLQSFLDNNSNKYYLQLDIKSFFTSINKDILWRFLNQHIKTIKQLNIKEKIFYTQLSHILLFQDTSNPYPKLTGNSELLKFIPKDKSLFHTPKNQGLPIGSLTSQFFANIYLNELDQFIKHKLKVKYYIRYVDDFVILHQSPQQLNKYKQQIDIFLKEKLKLQLHPKKVKLQHSSKGIDFLGYIVYKNYTLVRKRTVKALKRRLYFFNHLLDPKNFPTSNPPQMIKLAKLYQKGELKVPIQLTHSILKEILATINSYYGLFHFASSYNLRKKLYHKHFHKLKIYFTPKDKDYKIIQIKKWVHFTLPYH